MGVVPEAGREQGDIGNIGYQASANGRNPPGARPPVNEELDALGREQWGVFPIGQLIALGLSRSAVSKRVQSGRLHRIYQGVYSLVPLELLRYEARLRGAVFAGGPSAVISHRTAADLHDLRSSHASRIDVTVRT